VRGPAALCPASAQRPRPWPRPFRPSEPSSTRAASDGATAGALAFFAFFLGLPHVIDWGAILIALLVGAVARWAWQIRITKKHTDPQ
jgi:hypothetical protein